MLLENQEVETDFSTSLMKEAGIVIPTAEPAADPLKDKPQDKPEDKAEDKSKDTPADKPEGDKADEKKSPNATGTPSATDPPAATNPDPDIDDEKLLAALRKKTGRDIKSLDEFTKAPEAELNEDQKKQAAETERSAAIEFGKKQNQFTQAEYDSYVTFNQRLPADVVQEQFVKEQMAENKSLSKEDAQDLFNQVYHIMEDEEDPKYLHAQKLIKQQYDQIKGQQYGKIDGATNSYRDYQKQEGRAISFKNTIDGIFQSELPQKFDFVIDGEPVSFPVDFKNKKVADLVSGLKTEYLNVEMMNSTVDQTGKVDKAGLLSVITKDLKDALLENLITEVAKSYSASQLLKAKMGRKGAINLSDEVGSNQYEGTAGILSESDKMLAEAGYPATTPKT